jgi:two-component system, OmpR family, sensor histidine kinase MprB
VTLRARLTLVAAVAVVAAVIAVAAISYFSVQDELRGEFDDTLVAQAERFAASADRDPFITAIPEEARTRDDKKSPFESLFAQAGAYVQLVAGDGNAETLPSDGTTLPVDDEDLAIAKGGGSPALRDLEVDGTHVRMVTVSAGDGLALQLTRPLTEIDDSLASLSVRVIIVALGGLGVALGLGLAVARTALSPVQRLTQAAEHVAETQDLSASIETRRRDELGRLAASFNKMLATLGASRSQQRQLVADAGHELRTPLTSLRTNIEVLAGEEGMPPEERDRLLDDVTTQLEELSVLVGDLIELAREETPAREHDMADVRLDTLITRAVDRARTHAPALTFDTALQPTVVHGNPAMLERALANMLDNAAKWSPPHRSVEVKCSHGEVTVRDHGPGIDPEDLAHVFDRFYRAPAARALPGSGLGLAIVRRVAETHGGTVSAETAPGGGTLVRFRIRELEPPSIPTDAGNKRPAPTAGTRHANQP